MSKLLVIGTGPLYGPEVRQFNGQALRTWQFTECLRNAGHEVCLVVMIAEGLDLPDLSDARVLLPADMGGFPYYLVNTRERGRYLPAIEQLIDRFGAQGIIGVSHNAAWPACMLETDLPIWADLFGYMMGEAQAKAGVFADDSYLLHFWERQRTISRRADKFSAVSRRQMYATIGELGVIGRLNQYTPKHGFVCTIPTAIAPHFLNPPYRNERFRGEIFPHDAFAVLWSGGFNTWSDPVMLADALAYAMMTEQSLHFVVTGGAIPGHDERSYATFVDEMKQRGLLHRCTLLGWIENGRIFDLYRNCDLGLCVDSVNYETLMGARIRIVNMVAMQLPVAMTYGTEISEELDDCRGALIVESGNYRAMADALVYAARNSSEMKDMAQRAYRHAITNWTIEEATKPLLKWASKPYRAPDNEIRSLILKERREKSRSEMFWLNPAHASISSLDEETRIAETESLADLSVAKRDLQLIRNKFVFRLWKMMRSVPQRLLKTVGKKRNSGDEC